jgi:hypothetical protein
MKTIRYFFAAVAFVLSSLTHAFTYLPVDGLWGVVSEQNLAVGRAFNLEMGGTTLVVTMYGYNAQGAPTFYVGGGALSAANVAAITLSEPQGGTCLGCPPTSGRLLSSPGVATFEFTSSTTGFVTLPGEARKAILKGAITRLSAPDGLRGAWAFTYVITTTSATAETPVFIFNLGPQASGNGLMADSTAKHACELQTSGVRAGYVLCIRLNAAGVTDRYAILKLFGNNMDGNWYIGSTISATATPYLFTARRFLDGSSNDLAVKSAPASVDFAPVRAEMQRLVAELEAAAP